MPSEPLDPPSLRRAVAQRQVARALWYVRPGVAEVRAETLIVPGPQDARVRTMFSALSRGTETLILQGAVPVEEHERMRAPLQAGAFPFPVKYGYCAAGLVEQGPPDLEGRVVFCLHPHQDMFVVPVGMLVPVPDVVPAKRATLAANMETALNAVWDASAAPGDRIVIVGAGIVGLLVASLCARIPGADVTVVDVLIERRAITEALGARFALPGDAPIDADIVFHTSAAAAGLDTAIRAAGQEATVVEMSWYGAKSVAAGLGGAFHSRRLRLLSSQVGHVSAGHRPRWTYRRRLEKALQLLDEPALDQLVVDEIPFGEAASAVPLALSGDLKGFAPVIRY